MSKVVWTLAFIFLACEIYSLLPKQADAQTTSPETVPHKTGFIDVHSQFSPAGSNLRDVARAAKEAGADFVVITDNGSSQARAAGLEKNYEGVDVFVEMESSTPAGQCLTFYSHTDARSLDDDAANRLGWEHFLGHDNHENVFVVVAHPSDVRRPWNRLDRFPEGMELVNLNSAWLREFTDGPLDFLTTLTIAPFNNFLAALRFLSVYPKDFLAWDAMNAVSPGHFAILGHDNHTEAELGPGIRLPWPAPLSGFRLGTNVVFTPETMPDDFEQRKKVIYKALAEGKSALAFNAVYPYRGNDFHIDCAAQTFRSGDRVPAGGLCSLVVETPSGFPFAKEVRVWKDGEKFAASSGREPRFSVPLGGPGVYRAEVWATPKTLLHGLLNREVPYVLYNPVYVK